MDANLEFKRDAATTTALANRLGQCIVPLLRERPGKRPHLVGTGFLVAVATTNFLVSAAHVLDQNEGLFFYLRPGQVRNLTGGAFVSTALDLGGRRPEDRADVAVFRMDVAPPPYPEVDKFAIPASHLWPYAQASREASRYTVLGFPSTRTRANPAAKQVTSELLSFRNVAASATDYQRLGVSQDTHIVLPMDARRTIDDDWGTQGIARPPWIEWWFAGVSLA